MHRNIVITGGAKGIGQHLVKYFAQTGEHVYFIDIDYNATTQMRQWGINLGLYVDGFVGDIAQENVLEEFVQYLLSKAPEGIDCLINNACTMLGGILTNCSYEDFLYVQRVGVTAPFWLCKLLKSHFRSFASIINISSTRTWQSQPNTEAYTAAKGGITALTHALSISLAGIARVNAIAPGWIETGSTAHSLADKQQHPSQRVGVPQDIVQAVAFLSDNKQSFINGTCLTVDGGMGHLMVYNNDCGWRYTPLL